MTDKPCTGLYASVQQSRALLVETYVIGAVELQAASESDAAGMARAPGQESGRRRTRRETRNVHTLPKLDYADDTLEPHISGQIMELHHSKHRQTSTASMLQSSPTPMCPLPRSRSSSTSKKIISVTAAIQGSGWGWLGYNPDTKKLEIVTTPNQEPLLLHVLGIDIDIWEHAFYLQYYKVKQYYEVKADYLTAIWNVINFKEADRRFVEAAKSV
ncbi:hypothetical protein L227DRAFT_638878 [Lentinus tigrinus ALCF2SS1-6]|uniref:Superoxide dismutase n=1 Tax=Lentinus tigrinus ALCF2SS1-6 TaxID=1328759 RepID=A0A5C2RWX2_9APHY|nr:hypothetical protein L227DRAFT_638878 [Lentinus tigrinus ALCF2SS1-6]